MNYLKVLGTNNVCEIIPDVSKVRLPKKPCVIKVNIKELEKEGDARDNIVPLFWDKYLKGHFGTFGKSEATKDKDFDKRLKSKLLIFGEFDNQQKETNYKFMAYRDKEGIDHVVLSEFGIYLCGNSGQTLETA